MQIDLGMRSKLHKAFAFPLLSAFFVLLVNLQTFAALRCEKIYSPLSSYSDTNDEINELTSQTKEFLTPLKKARAADSKQIKKQVQKLMALSENYFAAAGIAFEPVKEKIRFRDLRDRDAYTMTYQTYRLHGSLLGDEFSRMIFGVETDPDYHQFPLSFVYDPLYQKNHRGSRGNLTVDGDVLTFGSDVFSSRLGWGYTLRHEIQHYFETGKIKRGLMTLARIELSNPEEAGGKPYADYVWMDELETHIRELRLLLNEQLNQKIDQKLLQKRTANRVAYIQFVRKSKIKEKLATLKTILQSTTETCQFLRHHLEKANIDHKRSAHEEDFAETVFALPDFTPYRQVRISLESMIDFKKASSEQVQQAIASILDWNLKRADEIQKEVSRMEAKAAKLGMTK